VAYPHLKTLDLVVEAQEMLEIHHQEILVVLVDLVLFSLLIHPDK